MGVFPEEPADADQFKTDAEVGGKMAAVVDGARRGIGAGHADGDYVVWAQRLGGNCRNESRIDAAAEGDENFAEAAFAHIIAGAEDQCAVRGLGVILQAEPVWAAR